MTIVVALAVALASCLPDPDRARCPDGWSVNGVRPSGEYECLGPLSPRGCGEPDETSPRCDRPASTTGRVRCTGGSRPIVVDHRTVGCMRGGWSDR